MNIKIVQLIAFLAASINLSVSAESIQLEKIDERKLDIYIENEVLDCQQRVVKSRMSKESTDQSTAALFDSFFSKKNGNESCVKNEPWHRQSPSFYDWRMRKTFRELPISKLIEQHFWSTASRHSELSRVILSSGTDAENSFRVSYGAAADMTRVGINLNLYFNFPKPKAINHINIAVVSNIGESVKAEHLQAIYARGLEVAAESLMQILRGEGEEVDSYQGTFDYLDAFRPLESHQVMMLPTKSGEYSVHFARPINSYSGLASISSLRLNVIASTLDETLQERIALKRADYVEEREKKNKKQARVRESRKLSKEQVKRNKQSVRNEKFKRDIDRLIRQRQRNRLKQH